MKSIALVIGVGDYLNQQSFSETLKDASDMTNALTRLGYEVICSENSNLLSLGKSIADFQTKAENYEIALFYFSGHGIMENGENYLCPIDVDGSSTKMIINTSKKLEDIMSGMPDSLKVKIFIIDACRTYIDDSKALGKGICPTHAPKGSIVAFATSPGVEASAAGQNGNSLYTSCLLKYIETKGIAIEECFKRVRTELYKVSNREQWSWEHTSLIGDYYFNNELDKKIVVLEDYSNDALADMNFIPDTTKGGMVVSLLKSHDWYKQKDGYEKFCSLKPNEIDSNYQFVIGRNLLQAACGDSTSIVEYFKNIGHNLLKWKRPDGVNHIMNGILYEMYFNREGNLRAIGALKSDFIDYLFNLEYDDNFKKSFEFINNLLIPYSSVLYYIPFNNEPNVSIQIELREGYSWRRAYDVKNIKYQGTSIYNAPEDYSQTTCREKKEFYLMLRRYFGVPKNKISIETNIPYEEIDDEIQIEYPLRLDVPKRQSV